MERELIDAVRGAHRRAAAALAGRDACSSPARSRALPLSMRGYGHVKIANVALARAREAELLHRFDPQRYPRPPSAPAGRASCAASRWWRAERSARWPGAAAHVVERRPGPLSRSHSHGLQARCLRSVWSPQALGVAFAALAGVVCAGRGRRRRRRDRGAGAHAAAAAVGQRVHGAARTARAGRAGSRPCAPRPRRHHAEARCHGDRAQDRWPTSSPPTANAPRTHARTRIS